MYRRKYVPLDEFLALCKRNRMDVTAENRFNSNGPDRSAASMRKKNRAKVAMLARCSKDAVRTWVLGTSPIPLWAYELLSYKWGDKKGLEYARKSGDQAQ
jgi:hypothetical protein